MSKQLTIFDALNEYKDAPNSVPFVNEVGNIQRNI